MTPSEWDDLLDLWADDALPQDLAARVEARMAQDPDFAAQGARLRQTVGRLRSVPPARADGWLAERVLTRLLREHDENARPAASPPNLTPALDILTP